MTIPAVCTFSVEGLEIGVVTDASPGDPICLAAARFASLLEDHLLPRFMAFRHGFGNCHGIVNQIYLDLKAIGLGHLFSFKRGSSGVLKTETDREGLHSWLETDGWVIDAANGSCRPVLVVPAEEYYANLQLTDICGIPELAAEEQ